MSRTYFYKIYKFIVSRIVQLSWSSNSIIILFSGEFIGRNDKTRRNFETIVPCNNLMGFYTTYTYTYLLITVNLEPKVDL